MYVKLPKGFPILSAAEDAPPLGLVNGHSETSSTVTGSSALIYMYLELLKVYLMRIVCEQMLQCIKELSLLKKSDDFFLSPAGRAGDYKTHSVRVFVCYY